MNAVDSEPVALVNLENQTDQGRLLHEKTMARRRLLVVHCIIAFFVCSSLFSIVIDQEYWPFSPYGMYSGIQQPYFRWTRFFGITQDGEIPLPVDQYAEPFDEPRFKIA